MAGIDKCKEGDATGTSVRDASASLMGGDGPNPEIKMPGFPGSRASSHLLLNL